MTELKGLKSKGLMKPQGLEQIRTVSLKWTHQRNSNLQYLGHLHLFQSLVISKATNVHLENTTVNFISKSDLYFLCNIA